MMDKYEQVQEEDNPHLELVEHWNTRVEYPAMVVIRDIVPEKSNYRFYVGYVQCSFPVDYDELQEVADIELTYGVDEGGWVGFDCGHAWDICLDEEGKVMNNMMMPVNKQMAREWTVKKVKDQCEKLALDLKNLESEYT